MHEAKGARGEQVGRRIDVAGITRARRQGREREAVRGDVGCGGAQDGERGGWEQRREGRGGSVVGVVETREGARARAREGGDGAEEKWFGGHGVVCCVAFWRDARRSEVARSYAADAISLPTCSRVSD